MSELNGEGQHSRSRTHRRGAEKQQLTSIHAASVRWNPKRSGTDVKKEEEVERKSVSMKGVSCRRSLMKGAESAAEGATAVDDALSLR